jgi:hypothetical protein
VVHKGFEASECGTRERERKNDVAPDANVNIAARWRVGEGWEK